MNNKVVARELVRLAKNIVGENKTEAGDDAGKKTLKKSWKGIERINIALFREFDKDLKNDKGWNGDFYKEARWNLTKATQALQRLERAL